MKYSRVVPFADDFFGLTLIGENCNRYIRAVNHTCLDWQQARGHVSLYFKMHISEFFEVFLISPINYLKGSV
jgi:hypothetical protein